APRRSALAPLVDDLVAPRHPGALPQVALGRLAAELGVAGLAPEPVALRRQPRDLLPILALLVAELPQPIAVVVAHEPHPHHPHRADYPRPAQAAAQAIDGRGVAGETVTLDAYADVAHDFPVLVLPARGAGLAALRAVKGAERISARGGFEPRPEPAAAAAYEKP